MILSVRNYKYSNISMKLSINQFKIMLTDILAAILPVGYKHSHIIFMFRKINDPGTVAEVMYLGKDDETALKQYIIYCNPHVSDALLIECIAHEFTHIKQYHKGELRDLGKTEHIWHGKNKSIMEPIDYWFAPWEIEARGMEQAIGQYLFIKANVKSMKGLINYYAKRSARRKNHR